MIQYIIPIVIGAALIGSYGRCGNGVFFTFTAHSL
jgi:hypothetical protein